MIDPGAITYGGREFSPEELGLIRQAACDYAGLGITEIARTICEWSAALAAEVGCRRVFRLTFCAVFCERIPALRAEIIRRGIIRPAF